MCLQCPEGWRVDRRCLHRQDLICKIRQSLAEGRIIMHLQMLSGMELWWQLLLPVMAVG